MYLRALAGRLLADEAENQKWLGYFDWETFLTFVGVGLASLSSFINCMGIQLQKLSLMQNPDDMSPWRQVKWVLGFYLIFSGSLIDFLAFGLAPQSLLAPHVGQAIPDVRKTSLHTTGG